MKLNLGGFAASQQTVDAINDVLNECIRTNQLVPQSGIGPNMASDAMLTERFAAMEVEWLETVRYPAIYFDNSLAADTGDGTEANPYRDFTEARIKPGYRHLLRAGQVPITVAPGATSTWLTTNVTGTRQAPVILGRWGTGTNPQINGAGANRGLRFGTDVKFWRVRDVEFYGFNTGSNRLGISVNTADAIGIENVTFGIVLQRVTVRDIPGDGTTDCNGVKIYGADNKIIECNIYNVGTDGVWFHGYRTLIQSSKIYRVASDGRIAGDCCQAGDRSDGTVIQGNVLDHRAFDGKQCVYFESPLGSGRETVGAIVQDNICYGFNDSAGAHTCIYALGTNIIVRRNFVTGGAQGITVGNGSIAHHNVILATVGVGIQLGINGEASNNTIIQTGVQNTQALSCGVRSGSSANYGGIARNNLIVGFFNSILAVTSAVDGKPTIVESNNAMATQGGTPAHYRLNGAIVAPSSTDIISTFATAATTFGYDMNYRPLSTSPLLAAAMELSFAVDRDKDYRERKGSKFPIGAFIGELEAE